MEEHNNAAFRTRWKAVWAETRPLKERLLLAALPAFLLCYTLFFFGPVELWCGNVNAMRFPLGDLALAMGLLTLVVFGLLWGLLLLLRGRVFNAAVSGVFGVALCCYIQGNIMNLNLGVLDGGAVPWHEYSTWALVNLGFWLLILLVPLVLLALSPRLWKRVVVLASALLVLMQTGAAVIMAASAPEISRESVYIDTDEMFELAADGNTIVFVLDRFPAALVEEMEAEEPGFMGQFADFTWFDNYASRYTVTFPALTTLLTGQQYSGSQTARDYLDTAWSSPSADAFYGSLRQAGYENRLYIHPVYTFGGAAAMTGQAIDNLKVETLDLDYPAMVKSMTTLSLYRYMPHGFKASFWMETDNIGGVPDAQSYRQFHNPVFMKKLTKEGLSIAPGGGKRLTVYHTKGAHSPYTINRRAEKVEESSWVENAMGPCGWCASIWTSWRRWACTMMPISSSPPTTATANTRRACA